MKTAATIIGVQYLRGLAAILVVLDHTGSIMGLPEHFGRSPAKFLSYGAVGVPIFFVVSGFIIAMASLRTDLRPRLSLTEFCRRRFVRIVPFMWCCIVGYTLLRFAGAGTIDWLPLIRAMVLWPVGELRPNVLWTLRHELLFYSVFGLTMLGAIRRWWLLIAWFACPFLVWLFQSVFGSLLSSGTVHELIIFFAGIANVHFGCGFLLGILYVRGSAILQPRFKGGFPLMLILVLCVFVILVLCGVPPLALTDPLNSEFAVSAAISILCSVLVWSGICLRPSVGRISDFGHFLGDASYSIYLVHNAMLLVFLSVLAKFHVTGNLWDIYAVLAAAAVTGGCVVHVLLERPMVQLAGKVISGAAVTKDTPVAAIRGTEPPL